MFCTKHIIVFSLPGTVFLLCCLVMYSAFVVGAGSIPHLTRQHYRKTVPSGEDNNRIISNIYQYITRTLFATKKRTATLCSTEKFPESAPQSR